MESENGQILVVNASGEGLPIEFLDLVFELSRQNPAFYKAWVELADNYVITGSTVAEA